MPNLKAEGGAKITLDVRHLAFGIRHSAFLVSSYTAKDITVLEGLDPVRKRPGMYIGGVGSARLHPLLLEILDNAIDQAMNRVASNIPVVLHADGSSITNGDHGGGVPGGQHPTNQKSA